MRRSIGWACALSALVVAAACSRDWEAFEVGTGTGGAAGADAGIGGGGVGGGACFPGAKVCPDPKNPEELLCLTADQPEFGCSKSTSCAPCALPHAKAKCTSGACAVDSCDTGWADCNATPIDGCETDLNGDKDHCGSCGNDCVVSKGAGWICASGVCEVNGCCPTGAASCLTQRDCDGNKTNGCETDVASDANNCKTCGNACSLSHAVSACSQEACVVTTCNSGWANCDKNDVNGCETNVSQGDKANCGACGKTCNTTNGGATCTGGSCVLACNPGFGNCNANPDDGCEVDLKTNPLHCGACSKACNPVNVNAATCVSGGCDYTSCKAGFTDCDGNRANGCEVNTAQDKNNCGSCNKVCSAPSGGSVVCSNGTCAAGCASGLTNCSGVCVNLVTDVNNCGNCASKCSAPANAVATCSGSGCGFICNAGFNQCGATCKSSSDVTACGPSCTPCPSPTTGLGNPTCSAGLCGIQCAAPTTGKCGTACYNFSTDKAHCGGCTTTCADPSNGTSSCVSGVCAVTCNSGYHKCGSTCRADNDPAACGASCTVCPGPTAGNGSPTCIAGSCGIQCSSPTTGKCGNACYDFMTDEDHCGSCTVFCPNACTAGNCT